MDLFSINCVCVLFNAQLVARKNYIIKMDTYQNTWGFGSATTAQFKMIRSDVLTVTLVGCLVKTGYAVNEQQKYNE